MSGTSPSTSYAFPVAAGILHRRQTGNDNPKPDEQLRTGIASFDRLSRADQDRVMAAADARLAQIRAQNPNAPINERSISMLIESQAIALQERERGAGVHRTAAGSTPTATSGHALSGMEMLHGRATGDRNPKPDEKLKTGIEAFDSLPDRAAQDRVMARADRALEGRTINRDNITAAVTAEAIREQEASRTRGAPSAATGSTLTGYSAGTAELLHARTTGNRNPKPDEQLRTGIPSFDQLGRADQDKVMAAADQRLNQIRATNPGFAINTDNMTRLLDEQARALQTRERGAGVHRTAAPAPVGGHTAAPVENRHTGVVHGATPDPASPYAGLTEMATHIRREMVAGRMPPDQAREELAGLHRSFSEEYRRTHPGAKPDEINNAFRTHVTGPAIAVVDKEVAESRAAAHAAVRETGAGHALTLALSGGRRDTPVERDQGAHAHTVEVAALPPELYERHIANRDGGRAV